MPLDLTPLPTVPPQRNALTSADVVRYLSNPIWANLQAIETLVETIETALNALPVQHAPSDSLPDSAALNDRWVDTSENYQEKICINAYTSGNGVSGDWVSMRDAATLTLATAAAASAAVPATTRASAFPSAYTQDWIFVDSTNGAMYVCTETYTASLPEGERASKFQALLDAATSAALTSVQGQLANFAADGIISSIEKRALKREWDQIQANKTLADTLASSLSETSSAQYIALVAVYDALNLYLNTTLNVFSNMDSDTSLTAAGSTRTQWDNTWKAWYTNNTTFQNYISTGLKTTINSNQSDETITLAEKREYDLRWKYEVKNYDQHDATTDALNTAGIIVKASNPEWQAYYNAYTNLNTYLNTTLDLFNKVDGDFPFVLSTNVPASSATEWTAKWEAYSDAERALSELTNTSFAQKIDALGDDGTISKGGEKNLANDAWRNIHGDTGAEGEYYLMLNRANNLGVDAKSLTSAYNDLKTYLLTTLTYFTNRNVDTTLAGVGGNSTWDSKWNNYYRAYANLDIATSSIADTNVGLITAFADDAQITKGVEKQQLVELMGRITIEYNKMITRAAIGVGASTTAYTAAYNALKSYLHTTVFPSEAAFNNRDIEATGINRTTWRTTFEAYYDARETLENAIISNNVASLNRDSAAIPNMATDNQITSEEKYVAQTYWTVIYGTSDNGEHNSLMTQAAGLGIATGVTDPYDDAFYRLWNFLTDNSHDPPGPLSAATALDLFSAMGTTKTLDTAQATYWQTYWSDYYTQRDTLIQQIQTELQADLDAKLDKSGGTMTGAINMGTNGITNMAQGAGAGQAVEWDQVFHATTGHANLTTGTHGVTGNIVGTSDAQTLTNKTITGSVAANLKQDAGGLNIVSLPAATDTLVGKATTDTLTNKTIDANGTGNSITNLEVADFLTGVVKTSLSTDPDDSNASLASAESIYDAIQTAVGAVTSHPSNIATGFATGTGSRTVTITLTGVGATTTYYRAVVHYAYGQQATGVVNFVKNAGAAAVGFAAGHQQESVDASTNNNDAATGTNSVTFTTISSTVTVSAAVTDANNITFTVNGGASDTEVAVIIEAYI